MAETTASDYFGSMVEAYDSLIRRAVPRYEEMTARLLDYLPPRATRVLELGCGTGNLSLALAARYPAAEITFVDAAPEMIAVTRARLEERYPGSAASAHFLNTCFEALAPEPGCFDLVASCISLHHVRDKAPVYRALRRALAAGGVLRFSDQLRGATEAVHATNWERWLDFCREPGNCTEAEVQSLLDHAAAHDHYTPLPEQFRLLADAGFIGLDCVWRNWIWGVITAEVP
jgi:tRNA (cmo5U34)-methyltransferase